MEYINRIEIQGTVGTVRMQSFEDRKVIHMSVATAYVYKGYNSEPVIETTWHQVTAWEGKNIQGLEKIAKGDKVRLAGRLKSQKYTDSEGIERSSYEIQASVLTKLDTTESLNYEMQ